MNLGTAVYEQLQSDFKFFFFIKKIINFHMTKASESDITYTHLIGCATSQLFFYCNYQRGNEKATSWASFVAFIIICGPFLLVENESK